MQRTAERIFYNGKIITLDRASTLCSALATAGERILATGSDDFIRTLAGPGTERIDLGGRAVMPGLVDGHAHMDREGLKDVYPSLAGARSIDDILARIAALVRSAKPGEWIVTMPIGEPPSYWDLPESLAEKRWPTRHDLDQVAPDNPVYIRPIWGFWRHKLPLVSIANSRALAECGIDRNTASPVELGGHREGQHGRAHRRLHRTHLYERGRADAHATVGRLHRRASCRGAAPLDGGLQCLRHDLRLRRARRRGRGAGGLSHLARGGPAARARQSGVQPVLGRRRRCAGRGAPRRLGRHLGRAAASATTICAWPGFMCCSTTRATDRARRSRTRSALPPAPIPGGPASITTPACRSRD